MPDNISSDLIIPRWLKIWALEVHSVFFITNFVTLPCVLSLSFLIFTKPNNNICYRLPRVVVNIKWNITNKMLRNVASL